MLATLVGYLIETKNNKKRIEALKEIAGLPESIKKKKKKKKKEVRNIQRAIIGLLESIERPPIPSEYTVLWSAESLAKIVGARTFMFSVSKEKVLSKLAKELNVADRDLEIAIHVLRGLGFLEIFHRGNWRFIGLTQLGKIVRDSLVTLKLPDELKIRALILASFPFSTKMRVVYGLYYMHGPDYPAFYSTLRSELFTEHYKGVERVALEVLYEMVLTKAGASEKHVSETHLLVNMLESYTNLLGGNRSKLNELFRAINIYVRYLYRDRYPFDVAAWEALAPGIYPELADVLKAHELEQLRPLFDKLKEEFSSIEYQLRGLYEFLTRY